MLTVNPVMMVDDEQAAEPLPAGVYPVDAVENGLPDGWVELFRVNDRVYAVQKNRNPQFVFRYMRSLRKGRDETAAMADLLYDVLGDGVMDAMADEDLSEAEIAAVMKAVQKYTVQIAQRTLGN